MDGDRIKTGRERNLMGKKQCINKGKGRDTVKN